MSQRQTIQSHNQIKTKKTFKNRQNKQNQGLQRKLISTKEEKGIENVQSSYLFIHKPSKQTQKNITSKQGYSSRLNYIMKNKQNHHNTASSKLLQANQILRVTQNEQALGQLNSYTYKNAQPKNNNVHSHVSSQRSSFSSMKNTHQQSRILVISRRKDELQIERKRQNQQFQTQMQKLNGINKQLSNKLVQLQKKLIDVQGDFNVQIQKNEIKMKLAQEVTSNQLRQAKEQLAQLEKQIEELKRINKKQKVENGNLIEMMKNGQHQMNQIRDEEIKVIKQLYEEKIRQKCSQVENLQKLYQNQVIPQFKIQIEELNTKIKQNSQNLKEKQQQLQILKNQNIRLTNQLQTAITQKDKQTSAMIQQFNLIRLTYEDQVNLNRQKLKEYDQQVKNTLQRLNQKIQELKIRDEELQRNIQQLQNKNENITQLRKMLVDRQTDNQNLRHFIENKDMELSRQRKQLYELKQEFKQTEKFQNQTSQQLLELKQQNLNLKNDYQLKISNNQRQSIKAQQQLRRKLQIKEIQNASNKLKEQGLLQQIKTLHSQIQKEYKIFQQYKKQHQTDNKESLQKASKGYQHKIKGLELEVFTKVNQVLALNHQILTRNKQVLAKNGQISIYKHQISIREQSMAKAYQKRLTNQERKCEKLVNENQYLKQEVCELVKQRQILQKQKLVLIQYKMTFQQEEKSFQHKNKQFQKRIQQLQQQNNKINKSIQQQQASKYLQRQVQKLTEQLNQKNHQIQKLQIQNKYKQKRLQNKGLIQQQLLKLQNNLSLKQNKTKKLQGQISQKDIQFHRKEIQLREIQNQFSNTQNKRQQILTQFDQLNQRFSQITNKYNLISLDNSCLKTKNQQLYAEIEKISSKLLQNQQNKHKHDQKMISQAKDRQITRMIAQIKILEIQLKNLGQASQKQREFKQKYQQIYTQFHELKQKYEKAKQIVKRFQQKQNQEKHLFDNTYRYNQQILSHCQQLLITNRQSTQKKQTKRYSITNNTLSQKTSQYPSRKQSLGQAFSVKQKQLFENQNSIKQNINRNLTLNMKTYGKPIEQTIPYLHKRKYQIQQSVQVKQINRQGRFKVERRQLEISAMKLSERNINQFI